MSEIRNISLTLSNHRHNKSYSLALESAGDGFVVNFAYGAIGSLQKPGTKTPKPVTLEAAEKIYAKLLHEKTEIPCDCCGGVYSVFGGESQPPVSHAPGAKQSVAKRATPVATPESAPVHPKFSPALLEPITVEQAGSYIVNPAYGAQRKFDGVRMAISRVGGSTVAFNRLGKQIPIPAALALQLSEIKGVRQYMLDGEFVGGEYVAFDLIEFAGVSDFREQSYSHRWEVLTGLLFDSGIKVAALATTQAEKMALIETEHEHRGEGVVFRKLSAPYMPGRQGFDVKLKYWASATLRICDKGPKYRDDGHNSFAVEALVLAKDTWINVGRVTCKGPLPAIGTYREVKYLYLAVGSRLYQAEDLGAREDVTDADCGFAQLKRKQSAERLAA